MSPAATTRLIAVGCRGTKWKLLVILLLSTLACFLLDLRITSRMFATLWRKEAWDTTVKPQCALQRESLQPLPSMDALVVSAYLDSRLELGTVRIHTILKRNASINLYCYFACRNGFFMVASPAKVNVLYDHYGFLWAAAYVLCSLHRSPCVKPEKVALVQSKRYSRQCFFTNIQNTAGPYPEESFTHEFGVCISSLFGGYNNVLQFTQAVEMYRLLGAGRVTIYNSSCGPELNRLLSYYAATGIVEVIPWPIDRYLTPSKGWLHSMHSGDVHYYGQISALNDCIYRHMYDTRYLVLNDIDEIIMPVDCDSWACLLRKLNNIYNADVYRFNNHVFPYTVVDDFGNIFKRWEGIPGHNILIQVRREPNKFYSYNPRKMIINPRQVVESSVHYVVYSLGKKALVSNTLAKLHHYRTPERPNIARKDLILDPIMWKYKAALVSNVDAVLHKSGLRRTAQMY